MNIPDLDSVGFSLSIQAIAFIVALIATQLAILEWRRNRNAMYKHLALGFGFLFIEITVITLSFLHSFWEGLSINQSSVVGISHLLRTAGYIYLAAAFITVKSSLRSKFIRINLLFLLLTITLIFLNPGSWGNYIFPIGFKWDFVFQVWHIWLVIHTIFAILKYDVRIKKGLVIATSILLLQQGIHCISEIYTGVVLLPVILVIERLLTIVYFYAIIVTLHKEIIAALVFAETGKKYLQEKAHQDTIRALINSLEAKDGYTRGHSDRVTEYSMVIGQKLGLNDDELTKLYYGAILHDIGKIGIDEEILNNPLSLCHDEFDCMKKHAEIGATIVSSISSLRDIAPAILHHHERFDGTGYPSGLKGHEIPLHARIIAISDALDAMSSKRTYRNPLTEETALRELVAGSGTQFDPKLVEQFIFALGLEIRDFQSKQQLHRSA